MVKRWSLEVDLNDHCSTLVPAPVFTSSSNKLRGAVVSSCCHDRLSPLKHEDSNLCPLELLSQVFGGYDEDHLYQLHLFEKGSSGRGHVVQRPSNTSTNVGILGRLLPLASSETPATHAWALDFR